MSIFNGQNEDNHWFSIADLMSVLMLIYIFISVIYIIKITHEKNRIEKIAVSYNQLQYELYKDLESEFKDDLKKWNAVLDQSTLSVRFEEPIIFFNRGSATLKEEFKVILNDFFPRYLKILTSDKYRDDVEEIRIEGHTSSKWAENLSKDEIYLKNMELSQDRTRNVLAYLLEHQQNNEQLTMILPKITTNGLSSSKLIMKNGVEDKEASRRVEFRVRTNAENQITRILTVPSN